MALAKVGRSHRQSVRHAGRSAIVAGLCGTIVALAGCGGRSNEQIGTIAPVTGHFGSVASDEPRATLAGRDILANNGGAIDAAIAVAFTLAVTLPSRAGLGGGGACLVHDARSKKSEVIQFLPEATAAPGLVPIAVPALGRGLFALHARYGRLRWEELLGPAEGLARLGHPVSRALALDLDRHGDRLIQDREAAGVYLGAGGNPLVEGALLTQFAMSSIISQFRGTGPAELHGGRYGHVFAEAVRGVGGGMTIDDLRRAAPTWVPAVDLRAGDERLLLLPQPVNGGVATAETWRRLSDGSAFRRAAGAARAEMIRNAAPPVAAAAGDRHQDASTGFVVTDRQGSAAACVLTMGEPFGHGRVARGTGVLLAPPHDPASTLAMAAALLVNTNVNEFFFAGAVGGDAAAGPHLAGLIAGGSLENGTLEQAFAGLPSGRATRAHAITCPFGAPRRPENCATRADPLGVGLAAFPGQ